MFIDEQTQPKNDRKKSIMKHRVELSEYAPPVFVVCFVIFIFASAITTYYAGYLNWTFQEEIGELRETKAEPVTEMEDKKPENTQDVNTDSKEHEQTLPQADKLFDMAELYEQNEDLIGWLYAEDTNIDYPVMQTPADENYYLERDFQKNYSSNGCLIMDTDSVVGSGTKEKNYEDGTLPGTNLIIHGHNMKNGSMFGNLDMYRDKNYEKEHARIRFSSLYEEREYEVVAVFLSQVYLKTQTDVFKYYQFFQADTEEEFDNFYTNIKKLALYDTGVDAQFGDEFLTLSVCTYHVENGRLVVVAKRVQ